MDDTEFKTVQMLSELFKNESRLNIIVYAAQLNGDYFRFADVVNKQSLGMNYDEETEAKNMQAHFLKIVKSGVFVSNGKKGCYVFNREILKQYSQSINNIINE